MCYSVALIMERAEMEDHFDAISVGQNIPLPIYHASAFNTPLLPTILDSNPGQARNSTWGLIPRWTKNTAQAQELRFKTFNARIETVWKKPLFRQSIRDKRCVVPVTGFFEWKDVEGRKYPYYIYRHDGKAFSLAGIWDEWKDGRTSRRYRTFSVLTTVANDELARLHDKNPRMPVILEKESIGLWLEGVDEEKDLEPFAVPFPSGKLDFHPVSKEILKNRYGDSNVPQAVEEKEYVELNMVQERLF